MAQFTIYKSTDGSAPVLSGTNDSLCALLRACLVDGYGAKAAAGWTVAFDGTNKTAYRQGGGNQFYLRVQDDGPGAGTAKEARIRGYETMSDVDTGTGLFPTAAQFANGLFVRKSTTADATARAWIVVADDRTLYVFVSTGDTAGVYLGWYFGDFYSYVNSDGFRTGIIGNNGENGASTSNLPLLGAGGIAATNLGHYIARGYTGLGTAVNNCKVTNLSFATTANMVGILTFPNPSDGGLYVAPIWISDNATAPTPNVRGEMRGMWCGLHPLASFTDQDTFSGTGTIAGKTFLIIKTVRSASADLSYVVIETSNTLATN